jgi:chemotaxis protein CheD
VRRSAERIHVLEGEVRFADEPGTCLTAVLGSCVAACLFDRGAGVGGMNHFLLAGGDGREAGSSRRYGAYLMEVLINGLVGRGAARNRIEAKLFGGASLWSGGADIGPANVSFAERFLVDEAIALVGGSLGGAQGRRVEFWPAIGRARQLLVGAPAPVLPPPPKIMEDAGHVEFF